jgi:hypothetical protein
MGSGEIKSCHLSEILRKGISPHWKVPLLEKNDIWAKNKLKIIVKTATKNQFGEYAA